MKASGHGMSYLKIGIHITLKETIMFKVFMLNRQIFKAVLETRTQWRCLVILVVSWYSVINFILHVLFLLFKSCENGIQPFRTLSFLLYVCFENYSTRLTSGPRFVISFTNILNLYLLRKFMWHHFINCKILKKWLMFDFERALKLFFPKCLNGITELRIHKIFWSL
jgi:hypothetical protein